MHINAMSEPYQNYDSSWQKDILQRAILCISTVPLSQEIIISMFKRFYLLDCILVFWDSLLGHY